MSVLQAIAILAAGLAAGAINAVVGSGSLITFPVLVAVGLGPLVANVSNNVGLIVGSASAVHGYRRELSGQLPRILSLGPCSLAGGLLGAALLLVRPSSFRSVIPYLVLLAVGMVIAQPSISKRLTNSAHRAHAGGFLLKAGVFLTGVYGGYFGAAQGVILVALLAISLDDRLQRLTGLKNVSAFLVNTVAGILFIIFAPINWAAAGLVAIGSIIGGQLGSIYGRRLPTKVLRAIIVVGGTAIAIYLFVSA